MDQLFREKGIDKKVVIDAIKTAIKVALNKKFGIDELEVVFDEETGEIRVFAYKKVVKGKAKNPNEIGLQVAREYDDEIKMGDILKIELSPDSVGRIATLTAKQVIVQKIKEAEKNVLYNEYVSKINELVIGKVQKINKDGSVLVNLDKVEGLIPKKDQIPGERFKQDDFVKAVIYDVRKKDKEVIVYLSRTSNMMLRRLLENEIPEIAEGPIEVKSVSRDPGSRSKISVYSHNERVDPVGACVGVKGVRILQIVNELRGEKIDVIRYNDDLKQYIINALAPSEVVSIELTEENGGKKAEVVVPDHHLSLAIGKEGQNVRLAAKLIGVRIDILSESQKKEKIEEKLNG
jgi:N utilization substance protein A